MRRLPLLSVLLLLMATPLWAATTIQLDWDAPMPQAGSPVVESYVIVRHDATTATWTEIGRTTAPVQTYRDSISVPQTYTYGVYAIGGNAISNISNQLSVAVQASPAPPLLVQVTVKVTASGTAP